MNCSMVIFPSLRAPRPYWMPTLSNGRRAKPVRGSRPYTLTRLSWYVQRAPVRLVFGSYTIAFGTASGSQLVARRFGYPVPFRLQYAHDACPATAAFCSCVHESEELLNA